MNMKTRSTCMLAGITTAALLGWASPGSALDATALTKTLPPELQALYVGAPG